MFLAILSWTLQYPRTTKSGMVTSTPGYPLMTMRSGKVGAIVQIATEDAYVLPSGQPVPIGTAGRVTYVMNGPEKQGALARWEGVPPDFVQWQHMRPASPFAAARYLLRTSYRHATVAVVTASSTWSALAAAVVGPVVAVLIGGIPGGVTGGVVSLAVGGLVRVCWRRVARPEQLTPVGRKRGGVRGAFKRV